MAKILIIDDDPSFVHLLTNLIASFGETPVSAMQGTNVFQILEEETIDLILLDIYMPIVSGLTLIKQLKRHSKHQRIPVIMITGVDNLSLMNDCFEAGAADFITKPISPVVLQVRLNAILEKQSDIERLEQEVLERKRAEAALRKLSIAVDQSPDLLFLTDTHHRIEYANPKCLETTGYQLDEILGRKPNIFQNDHSDQPTYDHLLQLVTKKGSWKGQLYNRKKNGERFWVSSSISPVMNEQGKIVSFLVVQADITDRIAAEKALAEKNASLKISENRLRSIIEATGDGIVVLGRDKIIHFVNPASEKIMGKPAEKLVGQTFEYPLILNQSKKIQMLSQDHNEFTVDMRVVETETDDGLVWVASLREIPQSLPEPQVQASKNTAEIAKAPQNKFSTERVSHSQQISSSYLSNISHEFRTPMHAILSFANFGIKKINQSSREKLLHYFEQIQLSANRLMPLIDKLLELSSLESANIHYKKTYQDILPIFLAVIQEQQRFADEKNITIQLLPSKSTTMATFNKTRMIKVLRNLLQNAIHFSDDHNQITININQTEHNLLEVSVSDEGIGVPEQDLENIFIKFFQSNQAKPPAGTGMGLTICKHIIHEHSGKIWAKNNPDKGATFFFTLPVQSL